MDSVPPQIGIANDYVLIRRPAFPRWWDPIARPHVAILVRDPVSGDDTRYYISQKGKSSQTRREILDVADIDGFPQGTLLEVRYNATRANLYRLEKVDEIPCWRWIGRCRELMDFNYPSEIKWNGLLEGSKYQVSEPLAAEMSTN